MWLLNLGECARLWTPKELKETYGCKMQCIMSKPALAYRETLQ